MMQSGILFCQNFTLPTVILDSLIFEVRKGRSCDSLQVLNERLIKSQGTQLVNKDNLIRLTEDKVSLANGLVANAAKDKIADQKQFAQDLGKEKRKKKKWRNGFFILVAVIAAREGLNTLD